MHKQHFTIGEAQALVSEIKLRFHKIHALLAEIEKEMLKTGAHMRINRGNGKGPSVQATTPKADEVHAEIAEIVKLGIVIKDLKKGLVDFPHYLDGDTNHEVYLCFLVSEDAVRFWHEIDAGFSGRTPL
ncbi:MAG: DUF2203 domain-containing protein [Capsulimonadaceae bacterium]|nr:DUF2203 domain-containing protein [Capsulimonadaceae bacterium]